MSVVHDIVRTYRAPREVHARRMVGAPREDRALAILLGACALIYVAQLPRFARESHLDAEKDLNALLAGGLFGWLMVMPLVFYVLSILVTLVLKVLGQNVTGFTCLMAMFWALLASTPIWLLAGLLAGFAPGPGFTIVSTLAFVTVLVFAGAGLITAKTAREGSL